LLTYGGFPEPFLQASATETRRWSREYQSRVLRDDLRDLEKVHDITLVEQLAYRLPGLVGSPLSVNALREDLQVAHATAAKWLDALERLYVLFRLYPFGAPAIRAVKKEAKHYHSDWVLVSAPGPRFENLVACHLLKWCHYQTDTQGRSFELRYFRDVDRREVDFVLLEDGEPRQFIEAKLSDREPVLPLRYLKQRFPAVEAVQVVLEADRDTVTRDGIRVCPAHVFLAGLV
jgi:predicted AAA+ superfamily ATPase